MNSNDKRTTWENYASAWKETSKEAKHAAILSSVAPSCVYRDPDTQLEGHDALVEHMLAFHAQVPGGWFETTYFLAHHDRSIAKWNMRLPDGSLAGDGVSYGEYDESGRLITMTGFFGAPPA